jgi:hypothetical protein
MSPSPEMKRLPSSRSVSPERNSPGKVVFGQEIEKADTNTKLPFQFKVEVQATKSVTPDLKLARNAKLASINRSHLDTDSDSIPPQSKKRALVKAIPPQVPLEKLKQLQELLNNKDLMGHAPKKVRNVNITPVIAPAAVPISANKIDPERAAKGRQYIKERKIQDLKKKRLIAEQEARERERVSIFITLGCECFEKD